MYLIPYYLFTIELDGLFSKISASFVCSCFDGILNGQYRLVAVTESNKNLLRLKNECGVCDVQ